MAIIKQEEGERNDGPPPEAVDRSSGNGREKPAPPYLT